MSIEMEERIQPVETALPAPGTPEQFQPDESCQAPVILSVQRPEPPLSRVKIMAAALVSVFLVLAAGALLARFLSQHKWMRIVEEPDVVAAPLPAPPLPPALQAEVRDVWPLHQRVPRDSDELRKLLLAVPDIEYRQLPEATRQMMATPPRSRDIYIYWPDRAGLPVRMGRDSQLKRADGLERSAQARLIRSALSQARAQEGIVVRELRGLLQGQILPDSVGVLNEYLGHEDKLVRFLLVDLLSETPGRAASAYLVQRALFDISAEVRSAAVEALSQRPRQEYRELLLEGFRYPWAPAADHAAAALIALDDTRALPRLVDLLGKPGPGMPWLRTDDQTMVTLELVRVNHLSNCLLCHARSERRDDRPRAPIPVPGRDLPSAFAVNGFDRDWNYLRADVTYVHQDFTVTQPVEHHGIWPAYQRYDYVVRTRPVDQAEIKELARQFAPGADFEQRRSILFALRILTGRDAGETVRSWRELLDLD